MIYFAVYTTSTGAIQRCGVCPIDNLSAQAGSGETAMVTAVMELSNGSRKVNVDSIEGITKSSGNPLSISITGHSYSTGDVVDFYDVGGTTELNGNSYTITKTGTDTFTLDDTDSDDFTAWTSGGSARAVIDDGTWSETIIDENPLKTDLKIRFDRLENPYPESITITLSGIVKGTTDDPAVTGTAEDLNGTFVLTEVSAKLYRFTSGEILIEALLGTPSGEGGSLWAKLDGATDGGLAFYFGGEIYRGMTIDNTLGTTTYDSMGHDGSCFIN